MDFTPLIISYKGLQWQNTHLHVAFDSDGKNYYTNRVVIESPNGAELTIIFFSAYWSEFYKKSPENDYETEDYSISQSQWDELKELINRKILLGDLRDFGGTDFHSDVRNDFEVWRIRCFSPDVCVGLTDGNYHWSWFE